MIVSIALDIDNTLFRSFEYWKTIALKEGVIGDFSKEYNGIYKVRCSDGVIFADKLFGRYRDEWISGAEPYKEVESFIKSINNNDSIKYYIVTSRNSDVKEQTLAKLAKHNITGFEDVLFLQDKTQAPCNTAVDDHSKHVKAYTNKSRLAYLLDRPYNQDCTVGRRVNNLNEVYQNLLQWI
ncbi:MAG TPA: hypothetical protein VLA13_04720 [Massilibacterium sp.]|nr:hypothetical protein [Massilibacterium sp.]